MILEHPGRVPDRLSDVEVLKSEQFSRVLSKDSKSTPREVQILSKYCQGVLRGQISNTIWIRYGRERAAEAFGRRPCLGSGRRPRPYFLSTYCLNIVLEYFLITISTTFDLHRGVLFEYFPRTLENGRISCC